MKKPLKHKRDIGMLVSDNIEAMLAYWDKDQVCRFANKAYLNWFGKTKEDMVDKITMKELLGPLYIKNLTYITSVLNGKPQQFEREITTPDGEIRQALANYYPDFEEGTIRGFFVHIADITRQKKIEEQLQLMKVLAVQNAQLKDFCNIISHNLRAPLVNLSMISDFISESKDLDKREIMFTKIKPVISTLNETFDNLIESLETKEEIGLLFEKNNFEELTKKILEIHRIEIEMYSANIQYDFNEAEHIYYPKKYLDSILSNLISNALKYRATSRTPSILIKTEMKGNKICVKVIDNGSGIDLKKNKQHMFKMRKVFHDHPDAKGFGLFMTKTQVDAMGGEISVESNPDRGSIFTVEFNQKNTVI